jgi:hypothetical protein
VIIQLEGSGKWPNHRKALDVLQNGFIFRIIIVCHKELVLLRRIKTSEGLIKTIDSEIADNLEFKTEILPKISSALNAINRKYVCFCICFSNKWSSIVLHIKYKWIKKYHNKY